ncbi:MAG TPA: RNA-binding protein [Anaerolineales bacterium]|nr:RNA-binding protein [Anaerolineales bacterium]
MNVKLYAGNLPFDTTEEAIRELFAQSGTVVSVSLIKDRYTGAGKGFAFVEMSTQKEAQTAISSLNGHAVGDRQLKVSLARPREERSSFGQRGGYPDRDFRRSGRRR